MFKTTDLYDDYLDVLQVAAPVFRDFRQACGIGCSLSANV